MLISFESFLTFSTMVSDYENMLGGDYAIIVLSKEKLTIDNVQKAVPSAASIDLIDTADVVNEVKGALSENNLAFLKNNLPHFYRLKLSHYPSMEERDLVERQLMKINTVSRVETFAKSENKTYKLLLLSKTIILVFAVLMFVVTMLLIVRQMEVWRFEHSRRINIMAIFGAPFFLKSAVLFRLAFLDSLASSLITGGLFYYLSADSTLSGLLVEIGLPQVRFDPLFSTLTLFGLSLFVSLTSVFYVIFDSEEENE